MSSNLRSLTSSTVKPVELVVYKRSTRLVSYCLISVILAFIGVLHHSLISVLNYPESSVACTLNGTGVHAYDRYIGYGVLVKEILRRGFPPGDPILYEHRAAIRPQKSLLASLVIATGARVCGSLEIAWFIGDGLTLVLSFWLMWALLYLMTRARQAAVIGSLSLLFLSEVPLRFTGLRETVRSLVTAEPLLMLRIITPGFAFPWLGLCLVLSCYALDNRNPRLGLGAGLSGGLLLLVYHYYWLFLGCFLLILGVIIPRWNRKSRRALGALIIGFGSSSVLVLGWLGSWLKNEEFRRTLGGLYAESRSFSDLKYLVSYGLILSALILIGKRVASPARRFLSAGLLAGILCTQTPLLLGFNFQVWHWNAYLMKHWIILTVTVALHAAVKKYEIPQALGVGLVILLLAIGAGRQIGYAVTKHEFYKAEPEFEEMIQWVSTETEADAVIMALNPKDAGLLAYLTGRYSFLPYFRTLSLIPRKEILERVGLMKHLLQMDESIFTERYLPGAAYYLFDVAGKAAAQSELVESERQKQRLKSLNPQHYRVDWLLLESHERYYLKLPEPEDRVWQLRYRNPKYQIYARIAENHEAAVK